MRFQEVLAVIRRRWRWATAVTLLAVLAAVVWSLTTASTYRATGRVFFSLEYGDSASDLVQGSNYTQSQVASFAELVDTPAVLLPVIDQLQLDLSLAQLGRQVEAAAPVDTVLIEVSVKDTSPETSAALANAVIASLSDVVESLAPSNAQGLPAVRATTVAQAEVPQDRVSPDLPLALAVGLLAGGLLGLGVAAVRDGLDNRIRDAEVLRRLTERPVLGSIPTRSGSSDPALVVERDPHSAHAEAFRLLRTNLQFAGLPTGEDGARGAQLLAVTSALSAEGKTSIAVNLATALAETGARVVLVDADLRRPAVAGALGMEGAVGLTTVLLGRGRAADVIQEWGSGGLHVLTSGAVPPNPTELLGAPAMRELLSELRRSYDYVVVDSAPLLAVADTAVLSRYVDGILLVANVTRVRGPQFTEALEVLARVDARVLGVVLNQVRREEEAYRYESSGGHPDELADFVAARGDLQGAPRSGAPSGAARAAATPVARSILSMTRSSERIGGRKAQRRR